LSGNLTSEYIFFGGARIARRDGSGNLFFYLADHLGSSREIIQAGQTSPCYDADFYPFGGERAYTNTCQQNYKFTGKERDPESGLDNFLARYYGSSIGRFMSADDPFVGWQLNDPQSLNLYAYVQDNPINDVDPTGHQGGPIAGQCVVGKTQVGTCITGTGPFVLALTCQSDPACAYFFGALITGADSGDKPGVTATDNLQTAENQHVNNAAETLGLAAVKKTVLDLADLGKVSNGLSPDYIPPGGNETLDTTAGRINNETNGMKDSKEENMSLSSAEDLMAHQRFNAERKYGDKVQGRAGMMDPLFSGPGYHKALDATIRAAREDQQGSDPTNGAFQYNMRTPAQVAGGNPFEGQSVHTVSGPYTSPSPYTYIVTYGPKP